MNRTILKCKKCDYQWISIITPQKCPDCQTIHWNENETIPEPPFMKNEKWLNIESFGNRYQVSNMGRIFSNKYKKIIRSYNGGVSLPIRMFPSNTIKMKCYRVSHLVLKTFMPNEQEYSTVFFKNGDKNDTRLSNMQWHKPKY